MPKITKAERDAWMKALLEDNVGLFPSQAETLLSNYERSAEWMISRMKNEQRLQKLEARRGERAKPVEAAAPADEQSSEVSA